MLRGLVFVASVLTMLALPSSGPTLAQSPLGIDATVGGGLLIPQSSSLKGNIFSVYDYPLSKTSFSLGGKVRASLPVLPFSVVASFSYNSLSDDATITATVPTGTVNVKYTYSLSILSAGLGLEYSFLHTPIIKPYLALAGTANFISGTGAYQDDVIPESKLNATSRMGLDFGLGTSIEPPFLPFSLDVEAKYRMANLFGKEFNSAGSSFPGFGGIPQTSTYNLNDRANPNDARDHDRSINYFTATLGIRFSLL